MNMLWLQTIQSSFHSVLENIRYVKKKEYTYKNTNISRNK